MPTRKTSPLMKHCDDLGLEGRPILQPHWPPPQQWQGVELPPRFDLFLLRRRSDLGETIHAAVGGESSSPIASAGVRLSHRCRGHRCRLAQHLAQRPAAW